MAQIVSNWWLFVGYDQSGIEVTKEHNKEKFIDLKLILLTHVSNVQNCAIIFIKTGY